MILMSYFLLLLFQIKKINFQNHSEKIFIKKNPINLITNNIKSIKPAVMRHSIKIFTLISNQILTDSLYSHRLVLDIKIPLIISYNTLSH